jgi:hypothetical protein
LLLVAYFDGGAMNFHKKNPATLIGSIASVCLLLMTHVPSQAQMVNDAVKLQNSPANPATPKKIVKKSATAKNQTFSQNPSDQGSANQPSMQPDQGYQQNQNNSPSWSPQGQSYQQNPYAQDPNSYYQNNGGYQNYQNGQGGSPLNSVPVPKSALQR